MTFIKSQNLLKLGVFSSEKALILTAGPSRFNSLIGYIHIKAFAADISSGFWNNGWFISPILAASCHDHSLCTKAVQEI